MRILLTPLGQDVVKILGEEKERGRAVVNTNNNTYLNTQTNLNSSLKKNKKSKSPGEATESNFNINLNGSAINTHSSMKMTRNKNSTSMRHKTDLLNKLEMDQTTISVEELHAAKEINIKQKKISIPKTVAENYNAENKNTTQSILPELKIGSNKKLPNDTINTQFASTMTGRSKFTIKEILKDNSLNLLKTEYKFQKTMRDKLSRIDENQFRTTYEEKNYLEKLDEKLNKQINPDRINLIRYLNDKEKISDILIKKIANYDEEKINRVNKICQIVFHNEESNKLQQGIIQEKIAALKNKEKVDYKVKIEKMGGNIDDFSNILHNYDKKINNRERYRDRHNDIVKNYWRRYQIDRLARRGNNKNGNNLNNSSMNMSQDFHPLQTNSEIQQSKIVVNTDFSTQD